MTIKPAQSLLKDNLFTNAYRNPIHHYYNTIKMDENLDQELSHLLYSDITALY